MRKFLSILLILTLVSSTCTVALAAKGGVGPCLASCCLGPRVGLEMNEGSKIRNMEWIALIGGMIFAPIRLVVCIDPFNGKTMDQIRYEENLGGVAIQAPAPKEKGGIWPALGALCLGPRVGLEMNDGRKIRMMEWLRLVPFVNIIPVVLISYEAYSGKTMSQVAAAEKLDR